MQATCNKCCNQPVHSASDQYVQMVLKETTILISSGIVAVLFSEVPVEMFRQAELLPAPFHRTWEWTPVNSRMFPHGFEEVKHDSTLQTGPVFS